LPILTGQSLGPLVDRVRKVNADRAHAGKIRKIDPVPPQKCRS
jgi:hypothetical protein